MWASVQVVHLYNELRKLMPTIMQLSYAPRGPTASGVLTSQELAARAVSAQPVAELAPQALALARQVCL